MTDTLASPLPVTGAALVAALRDPASYPPAGEGAPLPPDSTAWNPRNSKISSRPSAKRVNTAADRARIVVS